MIKASSTVALLCEIFLFISLALLIFILVIGSRLASPDDSLIFDCAIGLLLVFSVWVLAQMTSEVYKLIKGRRPWQVNQASLGVRENILPLLLLSFFLLIEVVTFSTDGLVGLGWDAIDFWAPAAIFLGVGEDPGDALETVAATRHPFTTAGLLSLSASASENGVSVGIVWAVLRWTLMLSTFSIVGIVSGTLVFPLVAAFVVGSMPLMVNHSLLIGYNELITSAILVATFGAVATSRFRSLAPKQVLCSGLLLAVGLLLVKSTSLVSVLIFVFAACAFYLPISMLVLLLSATLLLCILGLQFRWHLPIGGLGISWWPNESILWLGGRPMNFAGWLGQAPEVLAIFAQRLLGYQSFSTAALMAATLPFFTLSFYMQGARRELKISVFALWLVYLHGAIYFLGACSSYGFEVSKHDTLLSRTIMPVLALSSVATFLLLACQQALAFKTADTES